MQVPADDAWQEEAAQFLIRSEFRPGTTIGHVEHVENLGRTGRTFGSVWHAMCRLIALDHEGAAGQGTKAERSRFHLKEEQPLQAPV